MARVMICPSCQSKGAVPDNTRAARIRCPKCGVVFDIEPDEIGKQPTTPQGHARSGPVDAPRPHSLAGGIAGSAAQPASTNSGSLAATTPTTGGQPARAVLLYALLG